jgi:hypothetical protein
VLLCLVVHLKSTVSGILVCVVDAKGRQLTLSHTNRSDNYREVPILSGGKPKNRVTRCRTCCRPQISNISLCTIRINKNKIAPVKMDKLMNCSNHGKTFPHLALDSTCRWGSVDFRFASRKVRKASRFPCQVQGDGLCLQQAHRTSPKHPQADSDGSIDTVYLSIDTRWYKMI